MIPKVLIVDDDQSLLRLTGKELEDYREMFSVVTAADGQSALEMISGEHVTLVVTDLRMPGVDGFELLGQILDRYPDIPVIVMTGYDRPKTRDVVLRSGATDYMIKPVPGAKLAARIIKILKQKAEGGSLHNVSLETYLQLVEMEQQTCTLRVIQKSTGKMGVLFFKNGELLDARIGDKKGREAAYEILCWAGVSLSIENACVIGTKQIEGELQAILLDAMRNRDEALDEGGELAGDEDVQTGEAILLDEPVQTAIIDDEPGVEPESYGDLKADHEPAPELTPLAMVLKKLVKVLGPKVADEDVYIDTRASGLVSLASGIGEMIDAGALNMIYINNGRKGQLLVIPGDETIVAALEPDTPRDRAIGALL